MSDEILNSVELLHRDIKAIKDRNTKVEADKAWEKSGVRIGSICVITYFTAATVLFCIGSKNYFLDAFVPVVGFFLSTQSLPAIKIWWIDRYLKLRQRRED